jgi:hypothetical protein
LRSVAAFFSQEALSSNGNEAAVDAGLGDRARHLRRAGDDHLVGDRDVAVDADAAADHAVRADRGAAGDADAAGDRGVRADAHVVADLHQVVDLDAVVDHGVAGGAAVDAGVGADLDVVADPHPAELLDLLPAPPAGAKPKPSAPMTAPDWTKQRSPSVVSNIRVARGASRVPAPSRQSRPTKACAPT